MSNTRTDMNATYTPDPALRSFRWHLVYNRNNETAGVYRDEEEARQWLTLFETAQPGRYRLEEVMFSPTLVMNRLLDGVSSYYRDHPTMALNAGRSIGPAVYPQQDDDYIMAQARMQVEYGTARRSRMAELARTGLSNKEIDEAGLWRTPLDGERI